MEIENATIEEIRQAYALREEADAFVCLICGESFERGVVYPQDGVLYEAGKFVKVHVAEAHGSVAEHLLGLGKKATGLTELQSELLLHFARGLSDQEVLAETGAGSTSTIRYHRFALREKERQAKVFLAIMSLVEGEQGKSRSVAQAKAAEQDLLEDCFPYGVDGPLAVWPKKEKRKAAVVEQLAKRFQAGKVYAEPEVNEILEAAYEDYVMLRRYLVEYGFLEREADGSAYWLKGGGKKKMDKREALKREYKMTKQPAGIYQVRNTVNGKVFVGSSPNLQGMFNRIQFQLKAGVHPDKELQHDWKELGPDAFAFEVLDELKHRDDGTQNVAAELETLLELWLEKLKPYGDKGYNKK